MLTAGARREDRVVTLRRRRFPTDEPPWLAAAERGRWSPLAVRLVGEGDPRSRSGWAAGAFAIQEEGAQVVALALGARPGDRVLDACAGRGQKATLLRELVSGAGEVWAADAHPAKLRALDEEARRLGLAAIETRAVDWTRGVGDVPEGFDRVLVDAPCTGTGAFRRRPEIAARLRPEDPATSGERSARILRGAATRARPGGRVVFAVCSLLPEECERVVAAVADVLVPAPFDAPEVAALAGAAPSFRLLPGRHGTDGYFVASLRRPA